MAEVQQVLVEVTPYATIISGTGESKVSTRQGHFLIPRARGPNPPNKPSAAVIPECHQQINFAKSWSGSPELWRMWVEKLRPKHEALWRELGILDGLVASTCRFIRHEPLLIEISKSWNPETNTFVFPWGEATVTLQDIAVLGGLPLLGCSVRDKALLSEVQQDVKELKICRSILNDSKYRKPAFSGWAKHFLDCVPVDSTGERVEHAAFLAMWLSMFVLRTTPFDVVNMDVFHISAMMVHGLGVALAPAALASLYTGLSALQQHISSRSEDTFVVSTPMNVLQIWVWEHFPMLRPDAMSGLEGHRLPRAARWDSVQKRLDSSTVRGELEAPRSFAWMPYRSIDVALVPQHGWVSGDEIKQSKELQSFARCIHACELIGMYCTAMYHPYRVARQLGFDQDVPGTVVHIRSSCKDSWKRYDLNPQSITFFIPEDPKAGRTRKYMKWWKSQSVADVSQKKMTNSSQEGASTAPDRGIKRQRQVTQVSIQISHYTNNCWLL